MADVTYVLPFILIILSCIYRAVFRDKSGLIQLQFNSTHWKKKRWGSYRIYLEVVQIMIGIMSLPFGLVLVDRYMFTGAIALPLWTGVWYIISGSLAVAAENTHRRDLVKACLGMNIVSSVFAGLGIILYSLSVYILSFDISPHYNRLLINVDYLHSITMTLGIVAVLLVLNILEMCIAIATSAFGCKC